MEIQAQGANFFSLFFTSSVSIWRTSDPWTGGLAFCTQKRVCVCDFFCFVLQLFLTRLFLPSVCKDENSFVVNSKAAFCYHGHAFLGLQRVMRSLDSNHIWLSSGSSI